METYNSLADFVEDPSHFGETQLLVTVKSFDLQAIRRRYLASRRRSKAGSVDRRQPAQGGVVALSIEGGAITRQAILAEITESRGVDLREGVCALSSEDVIYLFDERNERPRIIEHPWFSYIHTVKFNTDRSKLLVSSSGLDILFEIGLQDHSLQWEWLAWEHGINRGENPQTSEQYLLTRRPEEAESLKAGGQNVVLITKPKEQHLPTALRAAFINSAEYDADGSIVATQFHAGRVIKIDKKEGTFVAVVEGLTRPHGGMRYKDGYLVTDTAGGRVIYRSGRGSVIYDFRPLPGKAESTADLEWLQTSHCEGDMIVTIDSNRTAFVFFDTRAHRRMAVPFNAQWAVQDFVIMDDHNRVLCDKIEHHFKATEGQPR